MGIKQILAERNRRRLRFAVLRPKDPASIPTPDEFRKNWVGAPFEKVQAMMNDELRHGAIFVGYIKPRSRMLYDGTGTPTGDNLKPGDIIDEIPVFNAALEAGVYGLEPDELKIAQLSPLQ